jgi:hypothetical protein
VPIDELPMQSMSATCGMIERKTGNLIDVDEE